MKIKIGGFTPSGEISADFSRKGLALIADLEIPVQALPRASATLMLRWAEVAVICLIAGILEVGIYYRRQLLVSWPIAVWARGTPISAALIVTAMAIFIGLLLWMWEEKQLFLYGASEIVFGAFSAFQAALILFNRLDTDSLVAVAATVYLISTGIKHLVKALRKEADRIHLEVTKSNPSAPWPPSILASS